MSSAAPGDAPETTDTLLAEVDARLRLLEAGRPARLDGMAVSPVSKLPFKALQYREALIWRAAQLGRNAFEHFVNNKLASAVLLTRATVEKVPLSGSCERNWKPQSNQRPGAISTTI